MTELFRTVLNMSLTGSYVILAVLLVRLLLRRAPKKYSYALWSAAAFRLCCPVSFESVLSLFRLPVFDMTTAQAQNAATLTYIPENTAADPITSGIAAVNLAAAPVFTPTPEPAVPAFDWMAVAAGVWCAGMAVMLAYSLGSWLLLRRRLSTAMRAGDNVYESDAVSSPFIFGFIRPRIYLPSGLTDTQKNCVLAHERMHLKRFDHFIKLFAYGVLAVHWFNPVCHTAFHFLSRDMEMSCDEAVLRRNSGFSRLYSATLVSLAAPAGIPLPSPLAFGESGVKSRVKNILRWKKPRVWVSLTAAILCVISLVACAANPVQSASVFGTDYRCFDNVTTIGAYGWSGHYMTYTGSDYRITEQGELFFRSNLSEDSQWTACGTLEEFTLTEENFDALLTPLSTGWMWNSYSELFTLRQRTTDAWKAEIPSSKLWADSDLYRDRTTFHYVFRVEGGNLFICSGFYSTEDGLTDGTISRLDCVIPTAQDAAEQPLVNGDYLEGELVYRSPAYDIVSGADHDRYTVGNGMFSLIDRSSDSHDSLYDAFLLTDRVWQDFPFTEDQWNTMTINTGNTYELFRDAQFLDLSLEYFLLKTEDSLYICYGTHDPASPHSSIMTIYTLVFQESDNVPGAVAPNTPQ